MKRLWLLLFLTTSSLVYANTSDSLGLGCSTNPKTAWLDIVLLIDISSNMGGSNLRQVTSFPILLKIKKANFSSYFL
jgi:hypothetical protein